MLRIIKVGGSLLDWPHLPQALHHWLTEQPPALNVLFCGGGHLADCIRTADERFSLGDEAAHWLAIDCLSITTRLLASACQLDNVLDRYDDLLAWRAANTIGNVVFDLREFLHTFEAKFPGPPLPHDWTATSDSLAARLAQALAADELCLLKSTPPPSHSLAELATSGYIDAHFPTAAKDLPAVQLVNLRSTISFGPPPTFK
jgi:aspartokinase-like uncharacterized kinase